MKVPFVNLAAQHSSIKEELLAAIGRVMDHGHFILGEEVTEFEHSFAELAGTNYSVGPGDEVITVPNSFVASAGCISLVGATPVFVDVGDDYNLDPALIESAITPRTKAILPVHLTGRPADMDPIVQIANAHGLSIVEDCAQAIGAEYWGRRVGSLGTIGCFSLHPLKTLNACGDGGVLTTNDPGVSEELRTLRNIGLRQRDECVTWGQNSRLDTLQAAILLVKLKYLEEWTERRRANAAVYQRLLEDLTETSFPSEEPHLRAVYHTFVMQAERRDHLRKYLADKGVGTAIHYPIPIHLQAAAAGLDYNTGSFPVAEGQAKKVISLPVYQELGSEELEYVAEQVHSFYDVA